MARRKTDTISTYTRVYLVEKQDGFAGAFFGENDPSPSPPEPDPLPPELKLPIPFDVERYIERKVWVKGPVDRLQFEVLLNAEFVAQIKKRHAMLRAHYGVKGDTLEDWRDFAINLAADLVPGFATVEFIHPKPASPRVYTEAHVKKLYFHVVDVRLKLQRGRSGKATRISERQALIHVWNNWPASLGAKRGKKEAFFIHYKRCKQIYISKYMRLADLGRLVQK